MVDTFAAVWVAALSFLLALLCRVSRVPDPACRAVPRRASHTSQAMLGAKAHGHCKTVKEYECLANGDNMLSPEGDMEWYKRVNNSFTT